MLPSDAEYWGPVLVSKQQGGPDLRRADWELVVEVLLQAEQGPEKQLEE